MDSEYIFLSSTPMPYLTDCDIKHFGAFEYHCSRCCDHFVLIFMLNNHLKFTEDSGLPRFLPANGIFRKNLSGRAPLFPAPTRNITGFIFRRNIQTSP